MELGEDFDGGRWAHDPRLEPIIKMYAAAARLYAADVISQDRRGKAQDGGRAWNDFRGQQLMLKTLCAPLGVNPEAAARQVQRALDHDRATRYKRRAVSSIP